MLSILKIKKLFFLGVFISCLVAFFDLLTKEIIFNFIENGVLEGGLEFESEVRVFSFFSLVRVWNYGVSFGMFNSLKHSQVIFSAIQGFIALGLLFWLFQNEKKHYTYALGLIIGGALGNMIDRIQNGAVADFLDFHIATYHWPAFNLADSCVFIGVAILLLDDFLTFHPQKK